MSRSIGIFDSGIGGLSILKSLARKAVNENYIYLADNKIALTVINLKLKFQN